MLYYIAKDTVNDFLYFKNEMTNYSTAAWFLY